MGNPHSVGGIRVIGCEGLRKVDDCFVGACK